jgi:hypothetical protein
MLICFSETLVIYISQQDLTTDAIWMKERDYRCGTLNIFKKNRRPNKATMILMSFTVALGARFA